MGKINQGVLGGFSGKVGGMIGSSWHGISYMRRKPTSIKNPQTLLQKKQRGKFPIALAVLKPIKPVVRVGFKHYADRQSEFNAAMSYTLKHAILGEYPDYTIDYPNLLIARGTLTGANATSVVAPIGKIKLTWENNSGTGDAQPTDKAIVVAINPAKGEAAYTTEGAPRSAETEELQIPPSWSGNEVHIYLAFISEDGTEVATSTYCGSVAVG